MSDVNTPKEQNSVRKFVGRQVFAIAIASAAGAAAITSGVVNSCETVSLPPPGTIVGTTLPTPGTDISIPEGTLPPATNPPTTPTSEPPVEEPTTTSTTSPPLPVIPSGRKWTDIIKTAKEGSVILAGSGNHGNVDLADLDAHNITVRCSDSALIGRFRFSNVSNLSIEDCKIRPDISSIAIYLINGGHDLRFTRVDAAGGERGLLVQNDRKTPEKWTTDVVLEDSILTNPKIDTVAVYGGTGISILRNRLNLAPVGCNVEHQDGVQLSASRRIRIIDNVIVGSSGKDPAMNGTEKCPDGQGPHDQGIISTQATDLDGVADVLIQSNTVTNWWGGMPILVSDNRATNVRIIDNKTGCSWRNYVLVTGNGGGVVKSGNTTITNC